MTSPTENHIVLSLQEGDTQEPATHTAGGFELAACHLRGPDKAVCEDLVGVFQLAGGALLAAVIDGMGGMRNGRQAAQATLDALAQESERFTGDTSPDVAVVQALERAHARVLATCQGGGAAVVCAILTDAWVQPVHAGDSEALLMGQRGGLKFRTISHSPVGYAQEAGLLSEDEALVHPERHFVSNGMGVHGMSTHVGPRIPLAPFDTLLLASDGVTDNARESEIIDALSRGPLAEGVRDLTSLCCQRMDVPEEEPETPFALGKPDDLSMLVLRRGG